MKRGILLSALLLAACDSTGVGNPPRNPDPPILSKQEDELLADGDEGTNAGDTATSIVAIPQLTIVKADQVTTSDGAAAVGEFGRAFGGFSPKDCVTTTRAANVVTWEFKDCIGPFGLAALTGRIKSTYSVVGPGSVEIDVTDEGLTLEKREGLNAFKATVVLKAKANVTFPSADAKKVKWAGITTLSGAGRTVTHDASYDVIAVSGCIELAGNATTSVDDARGPRSLSSTLTNYHRCGPRRQCPSRGNLNLVAKPSGFWVNVRFLGGRDVEVSSSLRPTPVLLDEKLQCIP